MQFGRWYPLAEAATHSPAIPGVLQIRVATGLVDYPRGKSAMVHYALADDVRAAALAYGADAPPGLTVALLYRHLEIEPATAVDLPAFHAKLVHDFERRFGAAPSLPRSGMT